MPRRILCRNMRTLLLTFTLLLPVALACADPGANRNEVNPMTKDIVLAGGCFWGVEEYFSRVPGVVAAESGYAQSRVANPDYRQVCSGATGAAEAVKIVYDPAQVSLDRLLAHYFRIIDPLAVNRQGNDVGTQYRTGIYYQDEASREAGAAAMKREEARLGKPLAVELAPLENFYPAEEYHQDYLRKNPGGYCHIDFSHLRDKDLQDSRSDATGAGEGDLRKRLSPMSWHVTQENGTEPPFSGEYNDFDEPGIYVDVVSGEPLFSSLDKFPSSCGWPSFARPIAENAVTARRDDSHGMERVEIRSSGGDSHLGHVFPDGPKERGGLRFCINSAALRFIPAKDLEKEGYGAWAKLFSPENPANSGVQTGRK